MPEIPEEECGPLHGCCSSCSDTQQGAVCALRHSCDVPGLFQVSGCGLLHRALEPCSQQPRQSRYSQNGVEDLGSERPLGFRETDTSLEATSQTSFSVPVQKLIGTGDSSLPCLRYGSE